MKPLVILFAVQSSAVSFVKYYQDFWDLPSILSFGSLLAFSGYLIVHFLNFKK
ncbi:hypothetical protein [Chryseobacterium oryzae]|uniref:F0F1-ATPase subunit Ca2+/Mg2+ transporter n=1 Tax=Chryseobacterium oryzae TaxID=2929799 RepID=A0ABY4BIR5_9FLAO|nr:hypothetical protein [Chryseobacterium oryzae]UOE38132.1 hypothetical protein MTP08_13925 [Chryseobacterium oryzae]